MLLSKGAHAATLKKAKSAEAALADEIISAANRDVKRYAINHRDSVERGPRRQDKAAFVFFINFYNLR
jgi:ribosomal protein S7